LESVIRGAFELTIFEYVVQFEFKSLIVVVKLALHVLLALISAFNAL
jgi:hypothetical protein